MKRGFTLIELLVVMGIMVLLITLALPAFNFMTGSRSGEAASNQIAGALGIARNQAVGTQNVRGVAIFRDENTDRCVAAVVELRNGPFAGWVAGTAAIPQTYTYGQYVADGAGPRNFVCLETYRDATGANQPSMTAPSKYWIELNSYAAYLPGSPLNTPVVEFKLDAESASLPTGIQVHAVGNSYDVPPGSPTATRYRYFSPAVFLFDANGHLLSQQFRILREGLLGTRINLNLPVTPAINPTVETAGKPNPYRAYSGIGLVTVDSGQYRNATASLSTVPEKENWLDQNATPNMINRYNGTLVKGD